MSGTAFGRLQNGQNDGARKRCRMLQLIVD
ncbi:hypothetical protein MELB17_13002 [Marinobacter sp. ELB17]|nr:hypothetical protein MELB17_13002 [Marinobacter sp. ELB17]